MSLKTDAFAKINVSFDPPLPSQTISPRGGLGHWTLFPAYGRPEKGPAGTAHAAIDSRSRATSINNENNCSTNESNNNHNRKHGSKHQHGRHNSKDRHGSYDSNHNKQRQHLQHRKASDNNSNGKRQQPKASDSSNNGKRQQLQQQRPAATPNIGDASWCGTGRHGKLLNLFISG